MILEFKAASAKRLWEFANVPDNHPIWSGRPYKKFLDSSESAARTINYVEDNPEKSGLEHQAFDFTRSYRGEWSQRH